MFQLLGIIDPISQILMAIAGGMVMSKGIGLFGKTGERAHAEKMQGKADEASRMQFEAMSRMSQAAGTRAEKVQALNIKTGREDRTSEQEFQLLRDMLSRDQNTSDKQMAMVMAMLGNAGRPPASVGGNLANNPSLLALMR